MAFAARKIWIQNWSLFLTSIDVIDVFEELLAVENLRFFGLWSFETTGVRLIEVAADEIEDDCFLDELIC